MTPRPDARIELLVATLVACAACRRPSPPRSLAPVAAPGPGDAAQPPPPRASASAPDLAPRFAAIASPVPGLQGATDIAMGSDASGSTYGCAVLRDHGVGCWGFVPVMPGAPPPARDRLTRVPGVDDAVDLALGEAFACARRADGTARCWGDVEFAAGETTAERTSAARAAIDAIHGADQLLVAARYVCWLRAGTAGCAGTFSNDDSAERPVELHRLAGVRRLVGDAIRVCAVMLDGGVRCVGDRFHPGGDFGERPAYERPTVVPNVRGAVDAVFNATTLLVTLDASGVARLAVGPGPDGARRDGVAGVASLSGRRFGPVCAARTDGSVACWGWNEGADEEYVWPPVVLDGLTDAARVARAGREVCVIRRDASVWCRSLDGTPWVAR